MKLSLPKIIQGGMGAGVSNWRLARAVSSLGQLGVVSGTALDQIMARRLQDGDADGNVRHALENFPYPNVAKRIVDALFVPGGKSADEPYQHLGLHTIKENGWLNELCMAANFVEVFLAREGHDNPVGINYLEKIQLPHLPSLYGAMLAGVGFVIVGAGIPLAFPGAIQALAQHRTATYPIHVLGAKPGDDFHTTFRPEDYAADFDGVREPLAEPEFVPIISSDTLGTMLLRKSSGPISGFVVEGNLAGGHNAPPRGRLQLADDGQPVYGPRDDANLERLRKLDRPFWLAGSYGSPAGLKDALDQGAAGIQVGTAFALCKESGLDPTMRHQLIMLALEGKARIFTDPKASPTGFPFKVACLSETLSEDGVYQERKRTCDLGFLRQPYVREDGTVGYRCPAEPEAAYLAKGGKAEDTVGRKCLCNALMANISLPQSLESGKQERCLVTMGNDAVDVGRFCDKNDPDFSAQHVIDVLLAEQNS